MDSNLECLTIQNISKLDINQDFAQKYLEYLMTLIQLNKPVDFIQAALVMQALSAVFAKKVDHLREQVLQFTIIFRKLELGKQNELGDANVADDDDGSENGDRARARAKKKNDREALLSRFKSITNDINLIRKPCIKKFCHEEIKKADSFLVRIKISECPRVNTKDNFFCNIYDYKNEKLGRKEEFSVNGILCNAVIPKDDFCLSCDHGENAAAIDDSVFNVPAEIHQMDVEPVANAMEIDHSMPDLPPSPIAESPAPASQSYQNVVEEFLNNSSRDDSDTSGFVYFEKMNKVGEALLDVDQMVEAIWTPIHNNNKIMERKLQKRNVVNSSENLEEANKSNSKPYPSNFVLSDLLLGILKYKSGLPFGGYIAEGLQKEEEYRRKMLLRKNQKRRKNRNNPIIETETEFRGFNAFGDDDDHDRGIFENENDIAPYEDAMPCNDSDNPMSPSQPLTENVNYLQGAIRHIEDYQKDLIGCPDDSLNEIAAKVSEWHDKIRPILEREEERTCFDIHEYGTKILNKFPKNNGKNTLPFSKIVENQPREEIARFFLSSLLLANTYNVEISKDDEDEMAVNDINLTLLSRVRQHEILDQDMRKEYS